MRSRSVSSASKSKGLLQNRSIQVSFVGSISGGREPEKGDVDLHSCPHEAEGPQEAEGPGEQEYPKEDDCRAF